MIDNVCAIDILVLFVVFSFIRKTLLMRSKSLLEYASWLIVPSSLPGGRGRGEGGRGDPFVARVNVEC